MSWARGLRADGHYDELIHVASPEDISMRTMWIRASIAALAAMESGDVSYSEGINLGKNEYLNSCASCHGATGKGIEIPQCKLERVVPS